MSSQEIAELTGKLHKNVLADIRVMLDAIGSSADFSAQYRDSTGRTLPCFHLPFDETMTLVAGYDAALRFKIVKRRRKLEQSHQTPRIPTHAEALRLAADGIERAGEDVALTLIDQGQGVELKAL